MILIQARRKSGALTGLLKDSIEDAAAKPGSEEVAKVRLNENIDRETSIISVFQVLNLVLTPVQVLHCLMSIVIDPLGHFERRILAASLTTEQLVREVVHPREQLWVERADVAEHLGRRSVTIRTWMLRVEQRMIQIHLRPVIVIRGGRKVRRGDYRKNAAGVGQS